MVHLGKEPGTKAYRLYAPVNKRVHVSRDVIFEETKPWLWKEDGENQSPRTETFIVLGTVGTELREERNVHGHDVDGSNEGAVESEQPTNAGTSVESEQTTSTGTSVESLHSSNSCTSMSDSETNSENTKSRPLADIYANTDEVELEKDELYFAAADEPTCYKQASKEKRWREAMEREM